MLQTRAKVYNHEGFTHHQKLKTVNAERNKIDCPTQNAFAVKTQKHNHCESFLNACTQEKETER